MFNKKFMDELFKPQELYSKKALRTVFDRLAHASIMRLNAASMDKVDAHVQYITFFVFFKSISKNINMSVFFYAILIIKKHTVAPLNLN